MADPYTDNELKQVSVDPGAATQPTLVAAVAGKVLRIFRIALTHDQTSIKFQSNSTDLSGALALTEIGMDPIQIGPKTYPLYTTAAGEAFNATLNASGSVDGTVWYKEG